MRNAKYLVPGIALVAVAVGLAIWLKQKPGPSPESATSSFAVRTKVEGKDGSARPASPPAAGSPSSSAVTATKNFEAVRQEIQESTVQYSESELPRFEKWLRDSNPEVRKAAARGLLDTGLAGGAPLLRDAATRSKEAEEIVELNRAASILELPPADPKSLKMGRKEGAAPPRRFELKDGVLVPVAPEAKTGK